MEKLKNILKNHEYSFGANLLLALYLVYLTLFHFYRDIQPLDPTLRNFLIIATSFFSIISFHMLIEISTGRWKYLYQFLMFFIVLFNQYLFIFHFRMHTNFEYAVVASNWNEMQNEESYQLVQSQVSERLGWFDLFYFLFPIGVLLYWGMFKNKLKPRKFTHTPARFVAALAVVIAVVNSPYLLYDELSYVMQSAYRYHIQQSHEYDFEKELAENPYPYVKDFKATHKPEKLPHILMVAIESFNANFALAKAPNGKEYTPVFNSKIPLGVYFKNFYGHSMQTSKGHFSLMCGLPPVISGKAMVDVPDLRARCLPEILSSLGYHTFFMQGYGRPNFDNTRNFMTTHGFQTFKITDTSMFSEEEKKKYIWGFGVQDNFTYEQAFENLDKIHAENPDKPLFNFIATISNHMDFRYVPQELKFIYPNKTGPDENYANSLRASDEFLKTFFEELAKRDYLQENTIIILTGDHSFSAGEHGHYLPDFGSFREVFHTPFLIIWPEHLKPEVRMDYQSQQDFAPTLADMLGYEGTVNFAGRSFYSNRESHFPIPLIQPYDGVHVGGIINELKYMHQRRTDREFIFDLKNDPHEKSPISSDKHPMIKEFREIKKMLYRNQYLIKNNQILPPAQSAQNSVN